MNIGDKVILIDDNWPAGIDSLYDQLPFRDIPYIVRHIHLGTNLDTLVNDLRREDCMALLLVGVHNPPAGNNPMSLERGFAARRFRKLDEMKTEAAERLSNQHTFHDGQHS